MDFNRFLVVLVAVLMLASCKIRIVVPEGGDVSSVSGAFSCQAGDTCDIDVVDTFFDEVFVANAAPGYTFQSWKRWRGSKNGFCGGSKKSCGLSTAGFEAFPALVSVLQSNSVFYLSPKFNKANSAGNCSSTVTSYNLTLSGGDTAQVGTSLITGDRAFGRRDLTGPIDALIIIDECSTISTAPAAFPPGDPRNVASFNLDDPDNTFVMVVSEAAISMSIVRNATPYRYACDSDFNVFMDCGGLDFDVPTQTLTMTNATVENTDTGSVLTINGTVRWN